MAHTRAGLLLGRRGGKGSRAVQETPAAVALRNAVPAVPGRSPGLREGPTAPGCSAFPRLAAQWLLGARVTRLPLRGQRRTGGFDDISKARTGFPCVPGGSRGHLKRADNLAGGQRPVKQQPIRAADYAPIPVRQRDKGPWARVRAALECVAAVTLRLGANETSR
jgi:hypothetical protein